MKQKVFFKTFGCRTNLFDSQVMMSRLKDFEITLNEAEADVIVVNSCTVTNSADSSVRGYINQIEKQGKAKLFLTGCGAHTKGESLFEIRDRLRELNWNRVGVARQASDLSSALERIREMVKLAGNVKVEGTVAYNMPWNIHIDLLNMIEVSGMVCDSAMLREETRGAHFRVDYPEQDDTAGLFNIYQNLGADGKRHLKKKAVDFKHVSLEKCQEYKK